MYTIMTSPFAQIVGIKNPAAVEELYNKITQELES